MFIHRSQLFSKGVREHSFKWRPSILKLFTEVQLHSTSPENMQYVGNTMFHSIVQYKTEILAKWSFTNISCS